jgi:FimV-like protein
MTRDELTKFKLELARAWIQNGHEDMARSIITKLINDGMEQNKDS